MTEAELAAKNLFEANQANALRVGPNNEISAAFGYNGQSTGGANTPAWSPGTAQYQAPVNPYLQAPVTNATNPVASATQQIGGSTQVPTQYAQTQQFNSPNSYLSTSQSNQYTNSNPTQGAYQGAPGSASMNSSAWGQSPWVKQTADALTAQSNQNLQQNVMPGIRSGAVSAGQYGSSRQGVAEGVAMGNAQTGLNSALANLYSNAYGQDQSASLQNKSLDNSYNLGLGNLSLTNQGQMQNFYTNQRGQDLQSAQIGGQLYGQGNQGNLGIGQGQYNIGQTTQNAPANAISQYNSLISPYTGYGQSTTQTGQSGGGAQGVIGGALAGGQIASNLGFGNTSNPYANYTGDYNSLAYRP